MSQLSDIEQLITIMENVNNGWSDFAPLYTEDNDFVNRRCECSKNLIMDESLYCLELLIKTIKPGTGVSDITITVDDRED